MPSITGACEGPMPSVSPGRPMTFAAVVARPAISVGWQG